MWLVPLFIVALSLAPVTLVSASTCALEDKERRDCSGDGVTIDQCLARGCCWQKSFTDGVPWCYYTGSASPAGYNMISSVETEQGLRATLSLRSDAVDGGETVTAYGQDIETLSLEISFLSADSLQIKITDANNKRWEVPETLIPRPAMPKKPLKRRNYALSIKNCPFSLNVSRVDSAGEPTGEMLFQLSEELVFKNQYIEMNVDIDEDAKTFGLGESTRLEQALKPYSLQTLWAADIAASQFYTNLYGSYPFYTQLVRGKAHGALLLNSNGMDVSLSPKRMRFQLIGGLLDLYIFAGSSPEAVVQQYTAVVGRPAMQPYWSFGLHNCRWGYGSLREVEEVVKNYSLAEIPLETQWVDIDYMQDYRDFTTNAELFPLDEMRAFVVDGLHAKGQRFVPIIDPGIAPTPGYPAYEEGLRDGVFLRDIQGGNYLGQVWPGATHFPDFLHPKIENYWTAQIATFHAKVPVDGLWIDMNEVSNFCNAQGAAQVCSLPPTHNATQPHTPSHKRQTEKRLQTPTQRVKDDDGDCYIVCTQVDASSSLDYPPYNVNNAWGKLGVKTLSMTVSHAGESGENASYYDTHNLYGLSEQVATRNALVAVLKKRPFVLSRSSFPSTGARAAKWTGDNAATWDDLRSSIVSLKDMSLFGVPMVGADICGFGGDTTEELCARWATLGAFYPFTRNHNAIGAAPQEFYRWSSVTLAARNALRVKYELLPFLYTLFYAAHTQGDSVVRALWQNFPQDEASVSREAQFMWGESLLFSPCVREGETAVSAYFPRALWYDWSSRALVVDASLSPQTRVLPTELTQFNVHVRGGAVLPTQRSAMTTSDARRSPFTLFAAMNERGAAEGSLFWDDGEQLSLSHSLFAHYAASYDEKQHKGEFVSKILRNSLLSADVVAVEAVEVSARGMCCVASATLNGQRVPFSLRDGVLRVDVSKTGVKITDAFVLRWE